MLQMGKKRPDLGQKVCWNLQSGGRNKLKVGYLVAFIPRGHHWRMHYSPEQDHIVTFEREYRSEDSYLVLVTSKQGAKPRLYWPSTEALTLSAL
jgi:hypothetical protein